MNFIGVFFLIFIIYGFGYAYGYGQVVTSNFKIVNSLQEDIRSPVVNQQLNLQMSLKNISNNNIDWVYISQVIDTNGAIVDLNYVTGSIVKNQSLNASISWTPHTRGNYKIETFVWDNLNVINPLSSKSTFTITIT